MSSSNQEKAKQENNNSNPNQSQKVDTVTNDVVNQNEIKKLEQSQMKQEISDVQAVRILEENERLKSLLQNVLNCTGKLIEECKEENTKDMIKQLQNDIINREQSLYEESQTSASNISSSTQSKDIDYFQGQSQNNSSAYDIRITLDSMYDLSEKKCKIQFYEKEKKKRNQMENLQKCAVIGFQGVKNRGKTFLLNLLNNEKFPSAFYESTLGISAKVDLKQNSHKIYLDSEGIRKPVKFNWNEAYKIKSQKRIRDDDQKFFNEMQEQVIQNFYNIKATEQLQQEFLLQCCEILIVVVGMISIEDQKLISSIVDRKLPSKIIIVHNYKELKEIKYVERHIDENLMFQFPLRKDSPNLNLDITGDYNNTVYVDCRYDNVAHVIFANNKSKAGEYYNKYSLEYIRQQIQFNTKNKTFAVSDKFVKFLNEQLPNYVEFKSQVKASQKLVKKVVKEDEDIIELDEQLQIKKIKDITLDVFGRIINAINYNVIQYKSGDQLYKKVDIELPGNITFDLENCLQSTDEKGDELVIKAQKLNDVYPSSYEDRQTIEDKRQYGEYILRLQISKTDEKLTQVGSIVNNKNGIYSMQFLCESSEINCLPVDEE